MIILFVTTEEYSLIYGLFYVSITMYSEPSLKAFLSSLNTYCHACGKHLSIM